MTPYLLKSLMRGNIQCSIKKHLRDVMGNGVWESVICGSVHCDLFVKSRVIGLILDEGVFQGHFYMGSAYYVHNLNCNVYMPSQFTNN